MGLALQLSAGCAARCQLVPLIVEHASHVLIEYEHKAPLACDKITCPYSASTSGDLLKCWGSQAKPCGWHELIMPAGRGDLAQLWGAARESEEEGPGAAVYQPGAGVALPGGVLAHSYGGELMDEGMPSRSV